MPMIDIHAPAGTFADPHALATNSGGHLDADRRGPGHPDVP